MRPNERRPNEVRVMRASGLLSWRVTGRGAPRLVARPVTRLIASELVEIPPGEQSGVMSVIEHNFDGIVSNRFDRSDTDIFLSHHQCFLSGTMSFDLGGGRMDPQVLERQLEAGAVCELHRQETGLAAYADFGCQRIAHRPASIGPSSL